MSWNEPKTEEDLIAREAFARLTLEDLRPLVGLIADDPPKQKAKLVPLLASALTDPDRVRALYDQLDASSQLAVRVAAFDPAGRLDWEKFQAWFGEVPRFNDADPDRKLSSYTYGEQRKIKPTLLRLFFPRHDHLPTDTRVILRGFVPPPDPFTIPTLGAPPATLTLYENVWHKRGRVREEREGSVRVRETAAEAEADLRAVLRLIEAGKMRVTDKKLVPTEATRQTVAGVLAGGDFYAPDDASKEKYDPAFDIGIRSFAWPVLVQTGGLAEKSKDALKLTAAGKKALTAAPPDVLDKLWAGWPGHSRWALLHDLFIYGFYSFWHRLVSEQ